MNGRIAIVPILIVVAAALAAGCATTPGPTPTPTVPPATTTPGTTATVPVQTPVDLVPGPTVTVPPAFDVGIDVIRDSNTYSRKITVIFQGGKGQLLTQRVDVTVTHDDGTRESKSITRPENGSIIAGSSVNFTGTYNDRIEVTVTINGVAYKIYDKVLPLQNRP